MFHKTILIQKKEKPFQSNQILFDNLFGIGLS